MKRGTLINCMDGRVQYPVMDYLKKNFEIDFFDAANEAGPIKILTERTDKCRLFSLKEQIATSLEDNGSRFLVLVGHHDCHDNPRSREEQEQQIHDSINYLRKAYGRHLFFLGLYVTDRWEVEEIVRHEPEIEA
ncbi:MAG: carbonic anhydrase [Bacteroidales bacterium]